MKTIHRQRTWLPVLVVGVLFSACHKDVQRATVIKKAEPSPTAPGSMIGPAGFPPPVMNRPYPGNGVVVMINRDEGWIEINHGEIKELMPAMQMEFNVKDKSLLDRTKVGERVDFIIVETEKGEYLTDIKPAANPAP